MVRGAVATVFVVPAIWAGYSFDPPTLRNGRHKFVCMAACLCGDRFRYHRVGLVHPARDNTTESSPFHRLMLWTVPRKCVANLVTDGQLRWRSSIQKIAPSRMTPATGTPMLRSSTGRHGTSVNYRLFSNTANLRLARSSRRRYMPSMRYLVLALETVSRSMWARKCAAEEFIGAGCAALPSDGGTIGASGTQRNESRSRQRNTNAPPLAGRAPSALASTRPLTQLRLRSHPQSERDDS